MKILLFYLSKCKISGETFDRYCVRLNPDGTIDNTFLSELTGFNHYGMALQTDGKVLIAGGSNVGTNAGSMLWRLNQDGTIDNTFVTDFDLGLNPYGNNGGKLWYTPDNKILLIGNGGTPLLHQGDQLPTHLMRVNHDGTLDRSFSVPAITNSSGNSGIAYWVKPLPRDVAYLMGGAFVKCNGQARGAIVRLNYNGFNR